MREQIYGVKRSESVLVRMFCSGMSMLEEWMKTGWGRKNMGVNVVVEDQEGGRWIM